MATVAFYQKVRLNFDTEHGKRPSRVRVGVESGENRGGGRCRVFLAARMEAFYAFFAVLSGFYYDYESEE